MPKGAIVLLADTHGHENLGRAMNALETAEQFKDAGDEGKLIFDAGGTVRRGRDRVGTASHRRGARSQPHVRGCQGTVHGACQFCANAFEVRREVEQSPVDLLDEHNRHPDLHALIADGYHVITF